MKNYTTLLFDLDGTLLDIEVSFFLGPLVEGIHAFFSEELELELFRNGLFKGTESIMVNTMSEGWTNMDGFTRAFSRVTGVDESVTKERFTRFYREVFPSFSDYGRPIDGAASLVSRASALGYKLCLATNPIFPVSAVLERLRWTGIEPHLFSFIPGLENMNSCKPRVEYFHDLAAILDVEPSECLMVGNDMEQDLPASETGMGTFLVEGHVVSRGQTDLVPDARGSLRDLGKLLGLDDLSPVNGEQ